MNAPIFIVCHLNYILIRPNVPVGTGRVRLKR
jgi:hypothetical protein